MSPPLGSLFMRVWGGETVEQLFKKLVENKILEAINNGESTNSALKKALKAFGTERESLGMFRAVPGFTLQMLATGLGSYLETTGRIDKMFPNDNRPGIKEIKFLLKNIVPHLIIGAGEGWNEAVERAVDMVRTDPSTPQTSDTKIAECDVMFVPTIRPDLGFTPVRNTNGEPEYYEDGSPRCKEPAYQKFLEEWRKEHGGRMIEKSEGGGKGQPRTTKKEWHPGDPLKGTFIPLTEWIMSLPDINPNMGRNDTVAMKKRVADAVKPSEVLAKPKTWEAGVEQDAWDVLFALTATQSHFDILSKDVGEGFLKQLPGKASVISLNELGKRFKPRIRADGLFDILVYTEAIEFIDSIMGAEIGTLNRLRIAFKRFRSNIRLDVNWKKALLIFLAAISPLLFYLFMLTFLTLSGVVLLICGWFGNLDGPYLGFENGRIVSFACVLVGGFLITFSMMLLAPMQALVTWIKAVIPGADVNKQSILDTGRKITAMVAPYAATSALLILGGAPRVALLGFAAAPLGSMGIAAMLAIGHFDDRIRHELLQAFVWFKRLTVIPPFIFAIGLTAAAILGIDPKVEGTNLYHAIIASKPILGFIGFSAVAIVGFFIVKKFEVVAFHDHEGYRTETTWQANWMMRLIVLTLAITVAIWIVYEPSTDKKMTTPDDVPKTSYAPSTDDGSTSSPKPAKVKSTNVRSSQKKSGPSKSDCDKMTYSTKEAMDCPL